VMSSKGALMHSFDGHNDVLLRLWRQGNDGVAAFLEGDGKGQLDLPRAREGGMVGGLYAIFAPSEEKSQADEAMENGTYDIPLPPTLELTHAQRATLEMASLLFRIAERSDGGVRIARSVADIRAAKAAAAHAPVLHIEGCEALDGDLRMLDVEPIEHFRVWRTVSLSLITRYWRRPHRRRPSADQAL
jgi:membrane dipeptidase